jgi:hypothetical protein
MENRNTDVYQTKDLHEAGCLLALGFRLVEVQTEGRVMWFQFVEQAAAAKAAEAYWSGVAVVGAKAYADSLRTLKDRLFAHRR